jgi:hypothetical protein
MNEGPYILAQFIYSQIESLNHHSIFSNKVGSSQETVLLLGQEV